MNYLSLTIGPIIETLSESKKTKELFAGSYIFSFMMKNILKMLKKDKGYKLIVPYHDKIGSLFDIENGIGMFHDRLIVGSEKQVEDIEKDIDGFINDTYKLVIDGIIDRDQENNESYRDKIEKFIKKYFQISYLITDEFSLKEISNQLDVFELHREFIINPDEYKILRDQEGKLVNPLIYIQRKFHKSFLKDDSFGDETSDFPSVLEISLGKDIEYSYDKSDIGKEEEALKSEKNYKKYMALIQGDGDRIGAILKKIDSDTEKVKEFSQKLLEYSQKIPVIAKKYGAKVVYAGGDDMLAFAPVVHDTQTKLTVFDFLKELDDVFKETMRTLNIDKAENVSQSFGVAIFYHKKPLYQALDKALYNLFAIAKNSNDRNKVVATLIKHSGQTFDIDFILQDDIYSTFDEILKIEIGKDTSALPHSVTHNISRSTATIKALADLYTNQELNTKISAFFENNFNKESHSSEATQNVLSLVKKLLISHIHEYQKQGNGNEEIFYKKFNHFISLLSFVKHLRGDR